MDYSSLNMLGRNDHNIPIILPIRICIRQRTLSTRNNGNSSIYSASDDNDTSKRRNNNQMKTTYQKRYKGDHKWFDVKRSDIEHRIKQRYIDPRKIDNAIREFDKTRQIETGFAEYRKIIIN